VHDPTKLAASAEGLSRVMTISDVAEGAGLSWDTVKSLVKQRLQKDYGPLSCKPLRSLSIDEIYVGQRKKDYTLVLDLASGRIVGGSRGRGQAAWQGFWRRLRKEQS
jgi:hypothetical protein